MSIVISVYSQNAYCEFLLPAVNNTDLQIVLKKSVFDIPEDVSLALEVVNHEWFLKNTEECNYSLDCNREREPLKDRDILTVLTKNKSHISLVVRETENYFSVFRKLDISSVDNISIGSEPDNAIVYQNLSLVSRHRNRMLLCSRG